VQNSDPSHTPSPNPPSMSIVEVIARAYERVRARILAGEPISDDLFSAFTARTDEHPDEKTRLHDTAAPHAPAEPHEDRARADRSDSATPARVTLDELLPVFRHPIEWALTRAERHAQGDPVDLAALGRVRAVYQSRLASIGSGGALGEALPKPRPTDLISVGGLVISSIDPTFAQRIATAARESLLDALAELASLGLAHAPGAAALPCMPCLVVPTCCGRHSRVL
jgi:hypothetical protein